MSTVWSGDPIEALYRARFSGIEDYRERVWIVLSVFFERWIGPNKTVLDLGCGRCEFINTMPGRVNLGMDSNPAAIKHCDGPPIRIFIHDASREWPVNAVLDVVFSSNFFEHLPGRECLQSVLGNAFTALRPGGILIALGPNIRYVGGSYWDYLDHTLALTDRSLVEALKAAGFEIETQWPRFLPYTMCGGRQYPMWVLRLYLRLPWLWRIFGKQFLIVARKPA